MAEIALGLVGPAIEVVKWVGAPILRQFKYLCCFTTNITNLEKEAENLQATEGELQAKVDAARDDVRVISIEVKTWLRNSKEIKDEKIGIMNEVPNVKGGCLKLRARFSLSKRANETADRLKKLQDQYSKFNDNSISQPGPPAATKAVPLERTCDFESRSQIEENIMATLKREDVKMMGICGMGGLGKTTMAKRIWNRALEEHVFQEVAMAVVSQSIDKLKIQLEIGGSLGLNLKDEISQVARVQKLHKRLSGTKRTLVILDDVWERLVPEDLGIPSGHKNCTILLTSRDSKVISEMNVQKIFRLNVLSEKDSWVLFKERAGTCVDDTKLNSIAQEVVKECKNLPLALTIVGRVLKDQMEVRIWEDAFDQLRGCNPDIQEISKDIYAPLRLSFSVLGPKHKFVFLLCCLFPEDAHIPLDRLIYICMGLGIFGGDITDVFKARNKMCAFTHTLKNGSLLLDSEYGDEYVRMHDIIRDVCIFIARDEGLLSNHNPTSSLQRFKLQTGFELLQIRDSADKEINCDGINRDLHVLSIERCSQLTSVPFTQRPNNLITLVLDSCEGLETLSVVGELVNLEILICRDCYSIEELPPEIKRLNRLKVLDLTKCRKLKRIGRGIISSLVGLEELKMLRSFNKWEAEDREGTENAGLGELVDLINLRCLEIEIMDFELVAKKILLSSKVDKFTMRFTIIFSGGIFPLISDKYLPKRKMSLKLKETTSIEHWKPFLRETECLILSGNGANKVCLPELEKIRYLELSACESMKNVVTSMDGGGGAIVFPSIEHLHLFKLPKLEEICDRPVSLYCFQILKELKLSDLPALKQLWKSSQNDLGKDFLPQLEVLEIRNCGMMETVFLWKGEDGNENNSCYRITKSFPKLKEVRLYQLPNLISLCQGIEGIEFPLMRRMDIEYCGKMKGMVSNGMGSNENNSGGSSSNAGIHALFCPQQVSFGCLKKLTLHDGRNPLCSHTIDVSLLNGLEELTISKCAGSVSLFTSSMAGNFVNLKELWIEKCDEMVEVIKDDEEKGMSGGRQTALLFPKLQKLILRNLPKLVSFCESKGIESIQFPVLRSMKIRQCGKMKGMVANGVTSNENNFGGSSTNAADIIHLFCQSKQVSFGCLKELQYDRNPFCSHTIHVSIFDRLEVLTIEKYEGSMSLFSSSITGNLVNLTRLRILQCPNMVKVIEEKEEEKEKVVSGAQTTTILFPKLHKIHLWNLHKLVRFCEWKCDVELPSLTELGIYDCDNMQSFTLGHLNTPKLESVQIDMKKFGGVKDLNGFLKQQYLSKAEEKEKKKKKNGQLEIKEEQN